MAFISKFAPSSSERHTRHSECDCGWRVTERDGVQVVQLDTYGSTERKIAGKVSQSLQLDRSGAKDLVEILRSAFPGI